MTRLVQTRVTDDQYDWLVEDAIHFYDGSLSRAVRAAVEAAQVLEKILSAPDPAAKLSEMIEAGHQEEGLEAYHDIHGRYPEDE
jgi:hypothetical protein